MENLIIIKTLPELQQLQRVLSNRDFIAFDTETDGVEKGSHIIGFSVATDVDTGYYVVLSYWDVQSQVLKDLETIQGAKDFFASLVGKSLIMQNAGFDCSMVENGFGVDLLPSVHTDTMVLAHLLDENRPVGLKELGVAIFGEDARKEQDEMKASVTKNGGVLTKEKYELYKADADLIARYGAKDAILTLKVFYHLVPELYEQGLDKFFYDDETMPLLRGATYDLNNTGLRIDPEKLSLLRSTLEADCLEAKAYIYREITPHVQKKYPGTGKTNHFNIGASKQLSWLLFFQLGNEFHTLTKEGRNVCKALGLKLPYSNAAKREFIRILEQNKDRVYEESKWNPKTRKMGRPKKIGEPWNYLACGKETLQKYAKKYKWVEKYLEYAKNLKLLNTYVEGIQSRMRYNVIRPSFLQHGTTSGRYSSRHPNFQNLPRKDKRIKSCIVARQGKVFVGADYSQLEPRVFASFSGDERLLQCFESGDDFYSVIGAEVFEKFDCSLKKDDKDSFANRYPDLRDMAKVIALSATYGTTAPKMAPALGKSMDDAQEIIDSYFSKFPSVRKFMTDCHNKAMTEGQVLNLFGRPRRMPKAKDFKKIYGNTSHDRLPYEARNLLNLAVNHTVQSTAASIMNRAAIAVKKECAERAKLDPRWLEVKIVLQVHDQLILEGPVALAEQASEVLRYCMENTVVLPGVKLIADPFCSYDLAGQK